jgi:hypothetical protein
MPGLDNPWVVTIVGGLIVSLIVRVISRPPSIYVYDLLVGLALFAMLQVMVVMLKESWLRLIADQFGERAYWVFFEAIAIIIVALTMERRQRNRSYGDSD